MKSKLLYLLVAIVQLGCSSSQAPGSDKNILLASALRPFGRYEWSTKKDLELISSGVHFGFSFSGTECRVFSYLTDPEAHNYLQYELDGVYQKRVKIVGNRVEPFSIVAASAGEHTVWVYKATEAHTGPIFIEKISAEKIQPLATPDRSIIEFIGNSITCGALSDESETPCGMGVYHDQHNAYYAYGPRVARALNVNFILSSVSGFGIYRTWNTDGPDLPQVYQKTDFQTWSNRYWNFKTYTPRIVSIALGTNDISDGDGVHPRPPFDSALFVNRYIRFVQLVKSKYPSAIIALLSSPMVNGEKRTLLQNCLMTVKQNIDRMYASDNKVALYFFDPMEPRGCSYHPSVEDHAILARELIPFFRNLLRGEPSR